MQMHVQGRRVDLGHLDSRHALQQAAHRAKGLADHAPALGQALLAIVQVVKTKVAGRANGTVRDALRLRGSHVHCGALVPAGSTSMLAAQKIESQANRVNSCGSTLRLSPVGD